MQPQRATNPPVSLSLRDLPLLYHAAERSSRLQSRSSAVHVAMLKRIERTLAAHSLANCTAVENRYLLFFFFFFFFLIFLLNVDIGNISRLNDLESLSYFSLFKYNIASINIFMVRKFFEISKKSFSRQNLLRKWSK